MITNVGKRLLTVCLWVIICQFVKAQQDFETIVQHATDALDLSQVPTNYLLHRTPEYVSLAQFDGSAFKDTSTMVAPAMGMVLSMMNQMNTNGDTLWPTLDQWHTACKPLITKDTSHIIMCLMEYDQFKPHCLDSNLLSFSNNQFHDVVGRPESPYETRPLIGISTIKFKHPGLNQTFFVDSQMMYTTLSLSSIALDVSDGLGWQTVQAGDIINATYGSYDTFDIKLRAITVDSDTFFTKTKMVITDPTAGMPGAGAPGLDYNTFADLFIDIEGVDIHGWYNKNCGDSCIRKPLIIVEGFDPLDRRDHFLVFGVEGVVQGLLNRPYGDPNIIPLSEYIHDEDYDIFFVNFKDGGDSIQVNSRHVISAIDTINALKHECGSVEKNVVIGTSMGGVVGKWALLEMEQNNQEHEAEIFFSFDSPLNGANVPLSLQALVIEWGDYKIAGTPIRGIGSSENNLLSQNTKQLNAIAAKQMLYYHYNAIDKNSWDDCTTLADDCLTVDANKLSVQHDAFYQAFEQLQQNAPLSIPHISISNGSIIGEHQTFEDGDELLKEFIDTRKFLILTDYFNKEWSTQIALRLAVLQTSVTFWFDLRAACDECVVQNFFESAYVQTILGIPYGNYIKRRIRSPRPYDSAPGGMVEFDGSVSLDFNHTAYCHIPTISSLDLDTEDPYYRTLPPLTNVENIVSTGLTSLRSYTGSTEQKEFYGDGPIYDNEDHVSFNSRSARYLRWELTSTNELTSPLDDDTYTMGKAAISLFDPDNFKLGKTENVIDFDLDITASGKLWINRDEKLAYLADNNHTNRIGQEYEAHITPDRCSGDSTTVNVTQNGDLFVGDQLSNNISFLYIHDDTKLVVGGSGHTKVESYSEIHVLEGAKIIVEPNGLLETNFEAKIYIHDGGRMIIDSAGIIQIMQQSELVVMDGGKLILKDGAKVRLWDGATGDGRANIHVYGELDIRGGIDFSGNGYFRFEPGNELTHENSSFQLTGLDKDVRMIQLEDNAQLNIGQRGLKWRRGKIVYKQGTWVEVPNLGRAICDSLTLVGTGYSSHTAFDLTHTKIATFDECDFIQMEKGIDAVDLDWSSSSLNLNLKDCAFSGCTYGVTVGGGTVARMEDVFIDGWNTTGWGISYEDMEKTTHERVNIQNYSTGAVLVRTEHTMFDNSGVLNCTKGVLDSVSHVFFHNGSLVDDNNVGVEVWGDASFGTIVEFGCSALTDNDVGVDGDYVLLSIDAGQTTTSGSMLGTNVFECDSSTQTLFYLRQAIVQGSVVLGRRNYWGGGPAHSYRICRLGGGGCNLNGDTNIDDAGYLTTEPISCMTAVVDQDTCDTPQTDPDGLPTTNGILFERGHGFISQSDFDSAYTPLTPVAQTTDETRNTLDPICQFQVDYARAYVGLPPALEHTEQAPEPNLSIGRSIAYLRPVPANEVVYIDAADIEIFEVYNLQGHIVTKGANLTDGKLNVEGYAPGVYIIRLYFSKDKSVQNTQDPLEQQAFETWRFIKG